VLKGEEGSSVSRIGKRLAAFDALEAGAYVVRPDVFDVLHRLLVESIYCTLAEAMQVNGRPASPPRRPAAPPWPLADDSRL